MKFLLFEFPTHVLLPTKKIVEDAGIPCEAISFDDFVNNNAIPHHNSIVLAYSDNPSFEGADLFRSLVNIFPEAPIWLMTGSYLAEDMRACFIVGYDNVIFRSPDYSDLKETIERLRNDPLMPDINTKRRSYKLVSLPLERELSSDRILLSIIDPGGSLLSSYYPVLIKDNDLFDRCFAVCVIQPVLSLADYMDDDFHHKHTLISHQLRLHMRSTEDLMSPRFGVRSLIHDNRLICLFDTDPERESRLETGVAEFLHRLKARAEAYIGVDLIAGYSAPYFEIRETYQFFSHISENIRNGYVPKGTVARLDYPQHYIGFSDEIDEFVKENLKPAIMAQNCTLLGNLFVSLTRRFQQLKMNFSVASSIMYQAFVRFVQETDYHLYINPTFLEHKAFNAMKYMVTIGQLGEFFDLMVKTLIEAGKYRDRNDENRLQMALQYIERNFSRKITLESISEYLALTPNYFCAWFKKQTGQNFNEVVTLRRIEAAKNYLLNSDRKICEIAEMVGYGEIVSFNRSFKKYVGMTPDGYRKRNSVS